MTKESKYCGDVIIKNFNKELVMRKEELILLGNIELLHTEIVMKCGREV